MNILHFTYSLSAGGRRNAIVNLASGLKKLAVTSYACSITSLTNSDSEFLQTCDFKDTYTLDAKGRYFAHKTALLKKLNTYCLNHNIDIVHTHDAASQILTALLCKKNATLAHVYTFHRSLSSDTAGLKNKARNFYANKFTNVITVGSNDRKNHIYENNIFLRNEKVKRIPFGIDTDIYQHSAESRSQLRSKYNINENDIVLGSIGHFGKEKGIDISIRSFHEIVKKSNNNVRLVILGKGNKEQTTYINNLIKQLALTENIILPGFDSSIAKWYSCFDILVHTPREEAFGLVLVEAMASGLPVVASRVGGIVDIVEHKITGYLAESGNIDQISAYTSSLIDSSEDRIHFGKSACKIASRKYSLSSFANEYLKIYQSLQ